jgi:hypothetical protein
MLHEEEGGGDALALADGEVAAVNARAAGDGAVALDAAGGGRAGSSNSTYGYGEELSSDDIGGIVHAALQFIIGRIERAHALPSDAAMLHVCQDYQHTLPPAPHSPALQRVTPDPSRDPDAHVLACPIARLELAQQPGVAWQVVF